MLVNPVLTRREVLRLAGIAVLAVGIGACSDDAAEDTFWTRMAEQARRDHPDLDVATATRELGASVTAEAVEGSDLALRRRLGERIRADFAEGRTLLVGGWLLARTEVQLALIVAEDK